MHNIIKRGILYALIGIIVGATLDIFTPSPISLSAIGVFIGFLVFMFTIKIHEIPTRVVTRYEYIYVYPKLQGA